MKQYLEAGKIVNTHGVHGEVKIQPWTSAPSFLENFPTLYIDGKPVKVRSSHVQKNCFVAELEGVSDIESAIRLKNKLVYIDRGDIMLDEGEYFIQDLMGIRAINDATGEVLGKLTDVLTLPANDVFVVTGEREILIPVVPEFVKEVNLTEGFVRVRLIEGM